MGDDRKANAKTEGDPVDLRSLVCAGDWCHDQYGAKN
jgi:hypothetical protein